MKRIIPLMLFAIFFTIKIQQIGKNYYWTAYKDKTNNTLVSFGKFIVRFLQFLTVSMGMSLHNSIAVIEGYRGIKSSFVRTPKFNIASGNKDWKTNKYVEKKINLVTLLEGVMSLVFFAAVIYGIAHQEYGLVPFHIMLFLGFGLVFLFTIGQLDWMNKEQDSDEIIDTTV